MLCLEHDFEGAEVIFQVPKPTNFEVTERPHPLNLRALGRFWTSKTHNCCDGAIPDPSICVHLIAFGLEKPTNFEVTKRPPPPQFAGAWSFLELQNPQILKCSNNSYLPILRAEVVCQVIKKSFCI